MKEQGEVSGSRDGQAVGSGEGGAVLVSEAEVAVLAVANGLNLEPDELAGVALLLSRYHRATVGLDGLRLDAHDAVASRDLHWNLQWK